MSSIISQFTSRFVGSLRPDTLTRTIPIGPANLIAQGIPRLRETFPGVLDHVGNTALAYVVSMAGSYAIARTIDRHRPEATTRTVQAMSYLGGASIGLAINGIAESEQLTGWAGLVSDHVDLRFGIAGALLGAFEVSVRRMRQQRHNQEALNCRVDFTAPDSQGDLTVWRSERNGGVTVTVPLSEQGQV